MARLTVTLCGSLQRAGQDLHRVHRALALAGHLVHAPVPALPDEPAPTQEQREALAGRHREAIRRSDLVIGVVPDRQPAGDATSEEMRYAAMVGVPLRWVDDVDALIADIAAGRLDQWPSAAGVPAG